MAAISVIEQPAPSQKSTAVSRKRCDRLPLIQHPAASISVRKLACHSPTSLVGRLEPLQKTYLGLSFRTPISSLWRAASSFCFTSRPVFCRFSLNQPPLMWCFYSWMVASIDSPVETMQWMRAVTRAAFWGSENVLGTWSSNVFNSSSENGWGFNRSVSALDRRMVLSVFSSSAATSARQQNRRNPRRFCWAFWRVTPDFQEAHVALNSITS